MMADEEIAADVRQAIDKLRGRSSQEFPLAPFGDPLLGIKDALEACGMGDAFRHYVHLRGTEGPSVADKWLDGMIEQRMAEAAVTEPQGQRAARPARNTAELAARVAAAIERGEQAPQTPAAEIYVPRRARRTPVDAAQIERLANMMRNGIDITRELQSLAHDATVREMGPAAGKIGKEIGQAQDRGAEIENEVRLAVRGRH